MVEWVAIDARKASLDKGAPFRAVSFVADDYPAARNAAVKRLGLAAEHRHFALVVAVAEGESVSDAAWRVTRVAVERRRAAGPQGAVTVDGGGATRGKVGSA